jgi:dephospho-CoA kinase
VDSIRNPEEVAVLRRLPGFVLIAIDAPLELRFARSLERMRPGDPETAEEFRRREEQENTSDPAAQQLRATSALADVRLSNEGSFDDLRRRVDELVAV